MEIMKTKMYSKITTLLFLMLCTICAPVHAQIKIVSSTFTELLVSPESLNRPIISIGPYVKSIIVETEIRNSETSELLIHCESNPITVRPGVNAIQPNSSYFKVIEFGHSELASYIRNQKRLPSGRFQYCLSVRTDDGEYFEDELCRDYFEVVNEFLQLVIPSDGDTITNPLPILNWTTSAIQEMQLGTKQYRLILTDKDGETDAETALNINPAIFLKENLRNLSVPYPASAPELEIGHSYAWRVECLVENQVVEETESWTFTMRPEKEKESRKYALLKTNLGGETYKVYDGKIYFAFEEKYFGKINFPKCQIRSDKGEIIENPATYDEEISLEENTNSRSENIEQSSDSTNMTVQGANKYVLDVTNYSLKPGVYFMEVWNFKNELHRLKFRIPE